MKINKNSLSERINNIKQKKNVDSNVLYSRYFFDCFLKRLSKSKYSNSFVLKGGLYLESILGIENRSTFDIDFSINKIKLEKDNVLNIIKEIISLDIDDNVSFEYIGDEQIRKDDLYGGFCIYLEGSLDNIKQKIEIDIATGDPVYPGICDYEYHCEIIDEILKIKTYSLESVTAEKLETFLERNVLNSRCKDLYDLYIIEHLKIDDENKLIFKIAFKKTCEHRKFITNYKDAFQILMDYSNSEIQKVRWNAYSKKNKYASEISYEDIMTSIEKLLSYVL